MIFPEAEYREVLFRLEQLDTGIDRVLAKVDAVAAGAVKRLNDLADLLGEAIVALANAVAKLAALMKKFGHEVKVKIQEVLDGAAAPIRAYELAAKWQDIRVLANTVATNLKRPQARLGVHWEGPASIAYFAAVEPQVEAAARIGTTADKVANALSDMAAAVLMYSLALLAATATFLVYLVGSLSAMATGVGAPPGFAALLGATVAFTIAVGTASALFMNAQNKAAFAMAGEAGDPTGFATGGTWPKAVAKLFDDATTGDGDPSDWTHKP